MAFKERIGATGDSLRIKNNEWYIARSFNGQTDIKIFRVNVNDEIEFFTRPSMMGDDFVLMSEFESLEERVAILEAIVASISAGNINIVPLQLSSVEISSKSVILPQVPLSGTAMIIPENGIPQLQGVDFNVTSNVISWDGMPYQEVAQIGDDVKIIYMFALTP
jgi:hypothetical protein